MRNRTVSIIRRRAALTERSKKRPPGNYTPAVVATMISRTPYTERVQPEAKRGRMFTDNLHCKRISFASGFCQLNNVLHVQDLFRIALANSVDHSPPHFLQGTKACWIKCPANGIEPGKKLVITLHIFLSG